MQTTIFSITNKANLDIYKPSAPTAPFIHGDDVIGELYQKNMVLFPFTIDLWAWFGPMLQAFLTTTHHPHQKPWRTTHTNNKYHRPNANLMYKCTSQPPCPLGITTSADLRWSQSASPTRRTFFGNSYTAPTPSLHTLQLLGLNISKAYSSLICNDTHTFQLHGMVQAWVAHFVTPLKCTYDKYDWQVTSQKPRIMQKSANIHHHHGGDAACPSSGVDLMNPCRLRGGRPCACSFQVCRRSDLIDSIN
jgi:hypothetical protein